MKFTMSADGGARGNPGPAGAGTVIHDAKGKLVATVSKFLGHRTNNFAEYEAVIQGFEALTKMLKGKTGEVEVAVEMDSELVVKQMNKIYKVKHPVMKEQQARLIQATSAFSTVSYTHIPRAENSAADALANEAMDRGT